MAAANNPLTPIKNTAIKLRNFLIQLVKGVFNKIKSLMRSILTFLNRVKSAAKELIGAIGKTAFNSIMALANRLMIAFPLAEKMATLALKTADRLLAFIKKTTDPNKAIKTVKKLVTQLVKQFRMAVHWVKELISVLKPLTTVLAIVSKAALVLRMIISWIADVSGVLTAVKKVKALLIKIMKILRTGLKEATTLAKEAGKLKPA
jgi:hypothetical protein